MNYFLRSMPFFKKLFDVVYSIIFVILAPFFGALSISQAKETGWLSKYESAGLFIASLLFFGLGCMGWRRQQEYESLTQTRNAPGQENS